MGIDIEGESYKTWQ